MGKVSVVNNTETVIVICHFGEDHFGEESSNLFGETEVKAHKTVKVPSRKYREISSDTMEVPRLKILYRGSYADKILFPQDFIDFGTITFTEVPIPQEANEAVMYRLVIHKAPRIDNWWSF